MKRFISILIFISSICGNLVQANTEAKMNTALNLALESTHLTEKQETLVGNLSTFFYYADSHQVKIILKRPAEVIGRVENKFSHAQIETAFDWAINIIFMSDELTDYGMITGIILNVLNTTPIGLDCFDILRLVTTNANLHPPYDETITAKDYETALYQLLSETPSDQFIQRMKNDPNFKRGMAKLILTVRQNGGI